MLLTKFIAMLIAAVALVAPGIPKRNPLAFPPVQNEPTLQDPAPAMDPAPPRGGVAFPGALGMVAQPAFPQADPFAPFEPMDPLLTTTDGKQKVIGVTIGAVDAPLAKQLGIDADKALLVASVLDGLPAEKAGIEAYDVLIAIDGDPITGSDSLRTRLAKKNVGDSITLTIRRGCETKQVEVAIAESQKQSVTSDAFGANWLNAQGLGEKDRQAFLEAQRAQADAQNELAKARQDLAEHATKLYAEREALDKWLHDAGSAQGQLLEERLKISAEELAKLREDSRLDAERYRTSAQEQMAKARDLLEQQQVELQRRNDQLQAERDRLGDALASQLQRLSDAKEQLSDQLTTVYRELEERRLAELEELKLPEADREKLQRRIEALNDRALKALQIARDRLDVPLVELEAGNFALLTRRDQEIEKARLKEVEAKRAEMESWAKMRHDEAVAQQDQTSSTNARLTTIEETLVRIEAKIDALSAKKRGSDN